MDMSAILSALHDVADILSSFLQLLFTRIIPVFAIFIASLFSRIFCSKSRPSSSSHPPDMCESPQEESDEDHDDMAPPDDGIFSEERSPPQVDGSGSSKVKGNEQARSLSTLEREILYEEMVRHSSTRNEVPVAEPIIYPSDLPESLDDVQRKPNADHLNEAPKRTLPPSLSMIKRTLMENSNKTFLDGQPQEIAVEGPVRRRTSKDGKTTAPANEVSRCQSEKLPASSTPVAKFHKYFSMGK